MKTKHSILPTKKRCDFNYFLSLCISYPLMVPFFPPYIQVKAKKRNEFSYLPMRQPDTGIFTVLKNNNGAYFSLLLELESKTEVFYMMNADIGADGYCYPT